MTLSEVKIVVDSVNENEDSNETIVDGETDSLDSYPKRGSMTIFTAAKTFQWLSRARINYWIKKAFIIKTQELPTCEEDGEILESRRSSVESVSSSIGKSPKVFYKPLRRTVSDRRLTLEPNYNIKPISPEMYKNHFDKKTVAKMMKSASGIFTDELTQRIHSTMLNDTVSHMTQNNFDTSVL